MNNVVIHVGFPKAASTTLQKSLFSQHSELINLGLYPTKNIGLDTHNSDKDAIYLRDDKLKSFYQNIVRLNESDYLRCDNHKNFDHISSSYLKKGHKTAVFSHEGLNSVFFANKDFQEKANRLKSYIPDAKILIVVRNQYQWLQSQYRDHPFDPRNFTNGKPMSFDDWFQTIVEHNDTIKLLNNLNYYNVASCYRRLFGKEKVCVLQFETLVDSVESFSKKIALFLEVDEKETCSILCGRHENKGVSNLYNLYRKFKRSYLNNSAKNNSFLLSVDKIVEGKLKASTHKKKYKLSAKNKKKLREIYANDNAELCDLFALEHSYFNIENG